MWWLEGHTFSLSGNWDCLLLPFLMILFIGSDILDSEGGTVGGGFSMKLWVEVYSPGLKIQTRRIYFWHPSWDFCGLLEPNFQLNSTSCFKPWNKTYPFSGKKCKDPYPIFKKNLLKTIPFGAAHTSIYRYLADIGVYPSLQPLGEEGWAWKHWVNKKRYKL